MKMTDGLTKMLDKNDPMYLVCNACGRTMLDNPDNRMRTLCIWCTSFGDGQKVRAFDAYVKEHGHSPVRVAPEKRWTSTPEIVREGVAPERKPTPPTTKKWFEKRVQREVPIKKVGPVKTVKSENVFHTSTLEIEGGDEKENAQLVKEALEDLEKIQKKKVKK